MGVDFDTCDTCGDTTCTANLTYMDLEPYGSYTTCAICVKKYFDKDLSVGQQRDILAEEEHGYIFFCADKTGKDADYEYSKKDAIFVTESFYDMEEFAEGKEATLNFGMIKTDEKDKREDWCFYDDESFDIVLGELFSTFVADQKKKGRDIFSEYEPIFVPDYCWKQLMQNKLEKQIEHLQMKKKKFNYSSSSIIPFLASLLSFNTTNCPLKISLTLSTCVSIKSKSLASYEDTGPIVYMYALTCSSS